MKLFSTVLKWQRAEKKWMDGDFMELEPELIEAEVGTSLYFTCYILQILSGPANSCTFSNFDVNLDGTSIFLRSIFIICSVYSLS